MKSNRFPFHFDSFERIKETKRNTLFFRLRCKNDIYDESTIDMCINALEIVHAFTGINVAGAGWWCSGYRKCENISVILLSTMSPTSRWVAQWLIYRRCYSKQMAVGCRCCYTFFFGRDRFFFFAATLHCFLFNV